MRGLGWLGVLLLLASALPLSAEARAQPVAPWWTDVSFDRDHDGIDDALAARLGSSDPLTVLVDYASMPTPGQRAALDSLGVQVTSAYAHFPILAVRALPSQVPALRALPGVVMLEHDDAIYRLLKDSVPLIGAPTVWKDYGVTGKGETIAILDDGAFEQHPDLQGKVEADFDAGSPSTPLGGSPVTVVAPAGTEGHGTHVAGIAVGDGAQSQGLYKGVAPDAKFANVKVFSAANATTSELVLRGLDWVLSNAKAHNIRIASMSLGGSPSDGNDAICRAVDHAVDEGLVVIAAAGNAGPDASTITAPGAAAKAITVGAVDKQKRIASYSSRGPTIATKLLKPDVVAPGSDITSAVPPSTTSVSGLFGDRSAGFYGTLSGTSMATPHVAGVAALMLEANPALTPADVKKIILVTAQDLGPKGRDNDTGFGFVNAIASVQAAKDPTILDQPQFASLLAVVPDAPHESALDQFQYDVAAMIRQGQTSLLVAVAVGSVGAVFMGVAIARRK